MSRETVWLQRSGEDVPWGFRLQGGRDHQEPLRVHKVFSGSVAARDLSVGDQVLRIGDTDTSVLTFNQAQEIVKTAGNVLQLLISRGSTDSAVYQPQQYGGAPETGYNYGKPPAGPGGQPSMPDAVLNMAARGPPEKKPWAYAPDLSSIQAQREKVRRSHQPSADAMLSPTFRAVHGLDSQHPRFPVRAPQAHQHRGREPAADDEMTFTGYNTPGDIPSKSFHRLQQNVGGSEIDTSSIRHNVTGEPENEIGGYDEASIRYRGRNIPSKSFRMLQNLTGGNQLNVPQARRARKPAPPPQEEAGEESSDDVVDISYVGGNIPSKSFQMLQQSLGEPASASDSDDQGPSQGRRVKVISLRSARKPPEQEGAVTDF